MAHKTVALATKLAVLSALIVGVAFFQPVSAKVIDEQGIETGKLLQAEDVFRGYDPDPDVRRGFPPVQDIRRGYKLPEFDGARGYGLQNDIRRGYKLPEFDEARGSTFPQHLPESRPIELGELYYVGGQFLFYF